MKSDEVNYKNLKIKNKLPQVIIDKNKLPLFVEWYNKDLRFLTNIPNSFKEGYIHIDFSNILNIDIKNCSDYIKGKAKELNTTYRIIENKFIELYEGIKKITLYFKFITDNKVKAYIYNKYNNLQSTLEFEVGEGISIDKEIDPIISNIYNWDIIQDKFNYYCIVIFTASMWYLATTTSTVKYYYEKNNYPEQEILDNKKVIKVKKHKYINTPIYDVSKIKNITVDRLVNRRKGWTYSHAFQVHGHYRHYKDGKTIFIEPYIKGKNKKIKQQIITISPS